MFVERLNYEKIAPAAIDALLGVENYVLQSGLEASLIGGACDAAELDAKRAINQACHLAAAV